MTPVSIKDFARIVLPHDAPDGWLVMLAAYFDDSGTHKNSDIVLIGGLMGNAYQWQYFSQEWAKKLKDPSPGKLPLRRFHMTHCQAGTGEFAGWGRVATDFLVHELGTIIINAGLYSAGFGVSRRDWDELVVGEMRTILGDAERYCVTQCYFQTEYWARNYAFNNTIAFVFDNRPERIEQNRKIAELMTALGVHEEALHGRTGFMPVSNSFADSSRILPLQGADLVAWEMYQQGVALFCGETPKGKIVRPQLDRLHKAGRIMFDIILRDRVEQSIKMIPVDQKPNLLKLFSTDFPWMKQFF